MPLPMNIDQIVSDQVTVIGSAGRVDLRMGADDIRRLIAAITEQGGLSTAETRETLDQALITGRAHTAVAVGSVSHLHVIQGPDADAIVLAFFERRAVLEADAMRGALVRYIAALRRSLECRLPYRIPGLDQATLNETFVPLKACPVRKEGLIEPEPAEHLIGRSLELRPVAFVTAPGGSGKSTITARIAARAWDCPDEVGLSCRHLPLWIRLRDFAGIQATNVEDGLWGAVRATGRLSIEGDDPPRGFVHQWPALFGAPWLFVFDGLDEVPADHREDVLDKIAELMDAPARRAIVTSRFWQPLSGSRLLEYASQLQLSPLASDAQILLTEALMGPKRSSFEEEVMRVGLRGVLDQPLLLGLAAGVFLSEGTLPIGRAGLLSKYLDLVLSRRENPALDLSLKERGLSPLARPALADMAASFTSEPEATSRTAVVEVCASLMGSVRPSAGVHDRNYDAGVLADALIAHSGLLVEGSALRFSHTLFREQLAAEHFAAALPLDGSQTKEFIDRRNSDDWRGIVLSTVGIWSEKATSDEMQRQLRAQLEAVLWPNRSNEVRDAKPGWWRQLFRTAVPPPPAPPSSKNAVETAELLLQGPINDRRFAEKVLTWAFNDPVVFSLGSCARVFKNSGTDAVDIALRCRGRSELAGALSSLCSQLERGLWDKKSVHGATALLFELEGHVAAVSRLRPHLHGNAPLDTKNAIVKAPRSIGHDAEASELLAIWLDYQIPEWRKDRHRTNKLLAPGLSAHSKIGELFPTAETAILAASDPEKCPTERLVALARYKTIETNRSFKILLFREVFYSIKRTIERENESIELNLSFEASSPVDIVPLVLSKGDLRQVRQTERTRCRSGKMAPLPEVIDEYFEAWLAAVSYDYVPLRAQLTSSVEGETGPPGEVQEGLTTHLSRMENLCSYLRTVVIQRDLPFWLEALLVDAIIESPTTWDDVGTAFQDAPEFLQMLIRKAVGGTAADDLQPAISDSIVPRQAEALLKLIDDQIARKPSDPDLLAYRVRLLELMGRYGEALQSIDTLATFEKAARQVGTAGVRLAFLADNDTDTIARAERFLSKFPGDEKVAYYKAFAECDIGKPREAISTTSTILNESSDANVLFVAGRARLALGFDDDALTHLIEAHGRGCSKVLMYRCIAALFYLRRERERAEEFLNDIPHASRQSSSVAMARLVGSVRAGLDADGLKQEILAARSGDDWAKWPLLALAEDVSSSDAATSIRMLPDAEVEDDRAVALDWSPFYFAGAVVWHFARGRRDVAAQMVEGAFAIGAESLLRRTVSLDRGFFDRLNVRGLNTLFEFIEHRLAASFAPAPAENFGNTSPLDTKNDSMTPPAVDTVPDGIVQQVLTRAKSNRLPYQQVCYAHSILYFQEEKKIAGATLTAFELAERTKSPLLRRHLRLVVLWFLEDNHHVYGETNFITAPGVENKTKLVFDMNKPELVDHLSHVLSRWSLDNVLFVGNRTKSWFEANKSFASLRKKFLLVQASRPPPV
jgi:tetratricopeptide (TPR) repeat protein